MSIKTQLLFVSTITVLIINALICVCIETTEQNITVINITNIADVNETQVTSTTPGVEIELQSVDVPIPYNERPLHCNPLTEVANPCANTCPGSCEDPNKEPCRNNYCWRGCECRPGYVKEHQNWTCIPVEQCPKCAANEHFRDCGTGCEPTCANYQNTPPHCNNHHNCKRGCFCNYGFVRDMSRNGSCVAIDMCPQKCGPNEYFEVSGPPCVRTATEPRPKCLDEPSVPACVCNTGFIRNPKTGQCQQLSNFVEKCGGNETFSQCGTECAQKCNDETKRHFCPTICLRGCFCNTGYVRDSQNAKCVLPDDCFKWNSGLRRRRSGRPFRPVI